MIKILDKVADSLGRFRPTKPRDYVALQMARKLGNIDAFRHYLILFEHYPEDLLVNIYHRCHNAGRLTGECFMEFLSEQIQ